MLQIQSKPNVTTRGFCNAVEPLRESRVVLRKVLVVVGIVDGVRRVRDRKGLGTALAVDVVVGTAVDGEVGLLVNDGSRAGVSAGAEWIQASVSLERDHAGVYLLGSAPESTAEVDIARGAGVNVGIGARVGASAVVGGGGGISADQAEVRLDGAEARGGEGAEPGLIA